MILAGLFAGVLFLGLIVGDWWYFIRLTPDAIRYGCTVGKRFDHWSESPLEAVRDRFNAEGVLMLPHGVARLYADMSQIAIRPQYRLFSRSFRTAWPVKGLVHLSVDNETMRALCVKRIPWSSALITLVWFALVSLGSLTFVIQYALEGGFASLGGILVGVGIIGLALLVLTFGLVTAALSYRLEDSRLMKVFEELRDALQIPRPPTS
jgi:hypothetical protein